jgi:type II secretion system protein I
MRVEPSARMRGFTLIEVLAALIIVSLGMLGVITAVGQTASNTTYLRDKSIAHWVAMNRLTEARLQRAAPKIDKTSDEVEMGGRRWRWTMEVTQTPVESIRRIDVNVRPLEADEKTSMAFVSGFYGTAVAPPGTTQYNWGGSATGGPGGRPGQDGDEGTPAPGDQTPSPQPPDPGEQPDQPTEPPPIDPPDESEQ